MKTKWELFTKVASYRAGDPQGKLRAAGLPTEFQAMSVGEVGSGKQVAIIPLDESNVENGRLIAVAPDMLQFLKDLGDSRFWRVYSSETADGVRRRLIAEAEKK